MTMLDPALSEALATATGAPARAGGGSRRLGAPQPVPHLVRQRRHGGRRDRHRLRAVPARALRVRHRSLGHRPAQPHAVHGRPLPPRRTVADRCRPGGDRRLRWDPRRLRATDAPDHRTRGAIDNGTLATAPRPRRAHLAAHPRRGRALVAHHDARSDRADDPRRRRRRRRADRRQLRHAALAVGGRRRGHRRADRRRVVSEQTGVVERVGGDDAQPLPRHRWHRPVVPPRCAARPRAPRRAADRQSRRRSRGRGDAGAAGDRRADPSRRRRHRRDDVGADRSRRRLSPTAGIASAG